MPATSVLMPVYNAERFVVTAIESILAQTYTDFDFIIVDDGSTDCSFAVVQQYAAKDHRIRVISRPNTGIVGALNDGLALCSGKYIARMDADDLCNPRRFELQLATLEANPALVALGSCATAIDPDGETLGSAPVPLTHDEIEASHLRGVSCIYHPAVMMRADAIHRVGGYRQPAWPAEDLDLWLRLAEVGKLANLPENLFAWRRTLTGIVASSQCRQQSAIRWILEDTWRRRSLPGKPTCTPKPVTSRADLMRQWGWMALKNGHIGAARQYARRSIRERPFCIDTWRLAVCTVRGW